MPLLAVARCLLCLLLAKILHGKFGLFFDEATPVFMKLSDQPTIEDAKKAMPTINRFTVLLYNKTSNSLTTNECRRELFCQGREIDKIPPTEAALWKHTCRSAYIAGYDWSQSTIPKKYLPSPEEWGWKFQDGKYTPYWTELPEGSGSVTKLVFMSDGHFDTLRPDQKRLNTCW